MAVYDYNPSRKTTKYRLLAHYYMALLKIKEGFTLFCLHSKLSNWGKTNCFNLHIVWTC
jgi:hypothetical protein